jgi:transposase-like protein
MTPRLAPRRSWAKANNPFWSNHVAAWYRSALEAEHYCRKDDLSTASLMRWARHLLSKEDLRNRAEHLRNLPRKSPKGQAKKRQLKPRTRAPRYRYGVRTDTGPVALQAFWSMHVEAMNFSGMGPAEYAATLGLSPHSLRIWRDRLEESGDEMDWRSLLHPSARAQLSSAANCARCKYRLTPQEADGRSNRRRFTDEQNRAMVQETEKPGVAVAEICRRHGIATSLLFRWRVQFGLTARKAPQLATVALADDMANAVPALAALRDLVRPPDGMMAIELDDGRRVFAPAGTSLAAVKRQLAGKEKTS